jgi:hypothetical protein
MVTSAVEQLHLDLGGNPPDEAQADQAAADIIASLLEFHKGDYRKVIGELLLDADFLRDQLYTASCLISRGMGRGWRPRYERV